MSRTSSAQNYIYNTLYKVLTLLTPLITAPYLARVIGSEGVGIYSYTYAIAYNFTLVAKLGLVNYGSRSVARSRDDKEELSHTFSEIYLLQTLTTAIACGAYIVFVAGFISTYKTICFINLIHVIGIAFDIDWLFYGLEKFKMTSIRNAAVKILTVIAILVFVKTKEDLTLYILIMALSEIIKYMSIWLSFSSCTRIVRTSLKSAVKHLKPTLILFIPVIATSIYRSMDKIMLGAMTDMTETGLYEYSEKIVYMLLGFVTSLEMVMMPKMSNLIKNGRQDEVEKNIRISMTFVAALTCAMAFGITGVSERFIPFFYGDEFIKCVELLPLLAITLIFIGWANVIRTQYIMPNGKDKYYVISTIIGAAINLVGNSIFIPMFQAYGAIIGTIAAELGVAVYLTWIVRKELPVAKYFKNCAPFIMIGLFMAWVVNYIGTMIDGVVFSLIVQIGCGAVIFVTLSCIYLKITHNELLDMLVKKISHFKR